MTKVRNGFALIAVLAVAGAVYSVLGGSWPDFEERFPFRHVEVAPAPTGTKQFKIIAIIDENRANSSQTRIPVWYYVDGKRYPGGKGNFAITRYWWRVLALREGQQVQINAQQSPSVDPEQRLDVYIVRVDTQGRETRILATDHIIGAGGVMARATAS